ncbi:hypothetical protein [Spiroplasma turonicum]|uniref:Uncharacterized protein n=1 Tax=Spiroplasma turonicum TaxID=216946 RepID=A0A0K1P6W1_9MOLU|nr:hypothetical protein [Spiroplasma turonicum]AKU80046.1 hypothetical protein STURON_00800 [Spiroplasma turonicum]ALX71048.1 hypothetical protein STURO_v1c07970 [Spiroplasma turonicum]
MNQKIAYLNNINIKNKFDGYSHLILPKKLFTTFMNLSISKVEYELEQIINISIKKKNFKQLETYTKKIGINDLFINKLIKNLKQNLENTNYNYSIDIINLLKILVILTFRYDQNIWFSITEKYKTLKQPLDSYISNNKIILFIMDREALNAKGIHFDNEQIYILDELRKLIFNFDKLLSFNFEHFKDYKYLQLKYFLIQVSLLKNYNNSEKSILKLMINVYFQLFVTFMKEKNQNLYLN